MNQANATILNGWRTVTWETIIAIISITAFRVLWISLRPLPHDVQQAIMNGLKRIRLVMRREVRVEGNAPYGIIWYGMNLPLGRLVGYQGRRWMILLALVDSLFLWVSTMMGFWGFLAYLSLGTFQLFRAPWNVTINWLILLGLLYWWFLLIAPLAKLPVGLPLHAFGDTGRGFFYKHNYVYYGLLGTFWLIVMFAVFIPVVRDASIFILGLGWVLLLGFLYFRRRFRTLSPTSSPH